MAQLTARRDNCLIRAARQSFTTHFIASKSTEKSALYLYTVKQKAIEPLREYMTWFNKTCLEILGLNEGVAVEAIK